MREFLIAYLSLSAAFVPNEAPQHHDCCRDLGTEIHYTQPPSDIVPPDDAGILDFTIRRNSTILRIMHPNGPRSVYRGLRQYEILTTADNGRTWGKETSWNGYGSTLASRFAELAMAPSDSQVLYKYIEDLGLYLRSEDGGAKWSLPRYNIQGLTTREFILKNGGSANYTTQFHLAAIDPHDPQKIYASVSIVPWATLIYFQGDLLPRDLPGVYVSLDGGESWSQFCDTLVNQAPLGISRRNGNVMFGQSAKGIVKSTDGGKSWNAVGQQELMSRLPDTRPNKVSTAPHDVFDVWQILVDSSDEDTVYVVSNKGIYRTSDGGGRWCLLNLGYDEIESVHSMAIDPKTSEDIVVGTTHGVFRSDDKGCTFHRIYPPVSAAGRAAQPSQVP